MTKTKKVRPMSPRGFGRALATLGLTQTRFAELAGIDGRTVRSYAAGADPVPLKIQRLLEAWLALGRAPA